MHKKARAERKTRGLFGLVFVCFAGSGGLPLAWSGKPAKPPPMTTIEANYDGLVGQTHNYAGLSAGNRASQRHRGLVSNPRAAALQGLRKMRTLMDMGLLQGVLPPQERPHDALWRGLGIDTAEHWDTDLAARAAAWSASPMWAANAASVSPSADTSDGRLHLSVANLSTMLHRSIEAEGTLGALRAAFPGEAQFAVHPALPAHTRYSDEGAANHMHMCSALGEAGVEVFVYGREADTTLAINTPVRQTLEASQAIARRHGLAPERCVFAPQSPHAIAAGAFHNDVVAVAHRDVMFYHEHAFADTRAMQEAVKRAGDGLFSPHFVEVADDDLPLGDAISSYLFNSQLVQVPGDDRLTLIAPSECEANPRAKAVCDALVAGNGPIGAVKFVDVRQSMANGGGPACLRLRVVMTPDEQAGAHQAMVMDGDKISALEAWVSTHYRDQLCPDDLRDPGLISEVQTSLDALTRLLDLGADFYPFQRV